MLTFSDTPSSGKPGGLVEALGLRATRESRLALDLIWEAEDLSSSAGAPEAWCRACILLSRSLSDKKNCLILGEKGEQGMVGCSCC